MGIVAPSRITHNNIFNCRCHTSYSFVDYSESILGRTKELIFIKGTEYKAVYMSSTWNQDGYYKVMWDSDDLCLFLSILEFNEHFKRWE